MDHEEKMPRKIGGFPKGFPGGFIRCLLKSQRHLFCDPTSHGPNNVLFQQCHWHHPPVITIFIGSKNHSQSWLVYDIALTTLHPIQSQGFRGTWSWAKKGGKGWRLWRTIGQQKSEGSWLDQERLGVDHVGDVSNEKWNLTNLTNGNIWSFKHHGDISGKTHVGKHVPDRNEPW